MAYFRIKEAAEKIGVLPHVLRFWESQFPFLKPSKTSRGQRLYSDEDLESFLRVRHLLYSEGYSIAGAKRVLKEQKRSGSVEPSSSAAVGREILKELANEVRELRDFAKEI